MKQLPARPNLEHLKRQAKDLLRFYASGDAQAIARLRDAIPAASDKDDAAILALSLRLHDAQTCVAREYGFPSWTDLRSYVAAQRAREDDGADRVLRWLRFVYAGDVVGGMDRARPAVAARMLAEEPALATRDPYLACAIGDESALRRAIETDRSWINRAGGPLRLPPLIAVTHSSLVKLPEFREGLHCSARLLLESGADPNQAIGSRWPPASLAEPSSDSPLLALYGAAGQNHDPELTRMLLEAGADPNDGESLYHSLESLACTRLLLEAGARFEGTNAVYRVLDLDDVAALRLLLEHGADPNEPARSSPIADFGSPLLWAIRRRRSLEHIEALLSAGADPRTTTPDGVTAYRLALRYGLGNVAALLARLTAEELSDQERFLAACACGDEHEARVLLSTRADLLGTLPESVLRMLPELAAEGARDAVKTMVKLGWPIEARGGDWNASALNLAVFRGDAELTSFLLEHGADWRQEHGFGDNVRGTLGWASVNEPVPDGDWVACAQTLVAHGMPGAQRHPSLPDCVLVEDRPQRFSQEVMDLLVSRGESPDGS